jgi:uncharacterized protein YjiS (DUF1127 family)
METVMSVLELRSQRVATPRSWTERIRGLVRRYGDYRRKRRAAAELRSIDPRILKDIAIDRLEIDSVVYGDPRGRRRAYTGG